MAIQTLTLNVNAKPSAEDRDFLYLSQNENGRDIRLRVLGDDLPSGCTATLSGVKPDGNVWSKAGTVTNNFVVVEEDVQMTAVAGRWDAQLDIMNGSKNIVTALIRITVEAAAVEAGAVPSDTQLEGYVEQCKQYAETAKDEAYGSPLTATTAAGMTDQGRVYVYTGSETGYTSGHWYYYNGSAWTDGGVYNAVAVDTDTTLSISGKAADAKETGDQITELKSGFTKLNTATNIDITTNGFVDTSGRVYAGDGTWKRSRYIQIDSINTLRCSFWAHRAVLNISFWTENFTFISGLGNTTRPEWGHASSRTYTLNPTDIPSNAVYVMYVTSTSNSDNYCTVTLKSREFDLVGKKYACMGDSITSDQVVGIGTLVNDILNTKLVGNFACGYATCSNWHTGDTDESPQTFVEPQNTNTADNVLMNQVLRLLQWTTASGEQVTWTHPVAGAYSVPTSIGTGLGHTDDIPDLIYIAIGVNDGRNAKNLFVDDSDAVMSSDYADLTKCSYASALRWAIETLNSAYPNAKIFVASPLFTTENEGTSNGHHNRGAILAKREVSKKIANYCNAFFIDSTYESGYTVLAATQVGNLHPNGRYKSIIGRYVANEIKRRYTRG